MGQMREEGWGRRMEVWGENASGWKRFLGVPKPIGCYVQQWQSADQSEHGLGYTDHGLTAGRRFLVDQRWIFCNGSVTGLLHFFTMLEQVCYMITVKRPMGEKIGRKWKESMLMRTCWDGSRYTGTILP
jgi:hypothetical protein